MQTSDSAEDVAELRFLPMPRRPAVQLAVTDQAEPPAVFSALHQPPAFTLRGLRNLFVHVRWLGSEGVHLARVEVRTPRGNLYTVLETPFDTKPTGPRRGWWKGGPVGTRIITRPRVPGAVLTRHVLAVAGTFIAEHAMRGTWSLALYVDQGTEPLARTTVELR